MATKTKVREEDGLPAQIKWRGEVYEVPAFEELEYWMLDGVCETPYGEIV